jgi:hypothetical protein
MTALKELDGRRQGRLHRAGFQALPARHPAASPGPWATSVGYVTERDQGAPPSGAAATGSWRAASRSRPSARPIPTLGPLCVRLVQRTRPGRRPKRVQRGLGGPHYRTPARVAEWVALSSAAAGQRAAAFRGRHPLLDHPFCVDVPHPVGLGREACEVSVTGGGRASRGHRPLRASLIPPPPPAAGRRERRAAMGRRAQSASQ